MPKTLFQKITPDQIQEHLESGTFTTALLDSTDITEREVNGKRVLAFKFPNWFYENVQKDGQLYAMQMIAKHSLEASKFAEYHPQIIVHKD